MLLNREEIKQLGLIENAEEENFKATAYDLSIGTIMNSDGDESSHFNIESGALVNVISKEIVNLPADITAFAHVKTGMSSQGLLALNIGLVDPGWKGPLSSTLVNFGDHDSKPVEIGELFLRLTFYKSKKLQTNTPHKQEKTVEKYTRETRKDFVSNFGPSFLNVDAKIDKRISERSGEALESRLRMYAIAFVFVQLAFSAFIYIDPLKTSATYDYDSVTKAMAETTSENLQLQREIAELRAELDAGVKEMDDYRGFWQRESRGTKAQLQGQIDRLQNRIGSLERRLIELQSEEQ